MNLSVEDLEAQIAEVKADHAAFAKARDIIRARVTEVRDATHPARLLPRLTEWSGTDAVLGSLDLTVHAMERTIDELTQVLEAQKKGRGKLRVIDLKVIEGRDDHGSEE